MNTIRRLTRHTPCTLAEGRIERYAPATAERGRATWRLQVDAGSVWITWPGCGDDVFLVAGEGVDVPAGCVVLAEVEPRLGRGAALLRQAPGPDRASALATCQDWLRQRRAAWRLAGGWPPVGVRRSAAIED